MAPSPFCLYGPEKEYFRRAPDSGRCPSVQPLFSARSGPLSCLSVFPFSPRSTLFSCLSVFSFFATQHPLFAAALPSLFLCSHRPFSPSFPHLFRFSLFAASCPFRPFFPAHPASLFCPVSCSPASVSRPPGPCFPSASPHSSASPFSPLFRPFFALSLIHI